VALPSRLKATDFVTTGAVAVKATIVHVPAGYVTFEMVLFVPMIVKLLITVLVRTLKNCNPVICCDVTGSNNKKHIASNTTTTNRRINNGDETNREVFMML
jgi:ribosomal protein S4